MDIPLAIRSFWQEFQISAQSDVSERFYEPFHFDDNECDSNELAELVLSGAKRATAGLLWSNEASKSHCLKQVPLACSEDICLEWPWRPCTWARGASASSCSGSGFFAHKTRLEPAGNYLHPR